MQPKDGHKKKIAIVGSGCAGLGAAWALKHSEYDIHLFEKSSRLGGHTNTQTFTTPPGEVDVDTGFIVMNTATYPNFINFLRHLNVPTVPTEMSFSVSRGSGDFEWSGSGRGLFAQRRNLFRSRHWRLIFDVVRFNQFALDLLFNDDADEADDLTIGQYLHLEGYSQAFKDDYLIPMTAAVWSTSPDKASLEFPARTLVRFMWNHHLLSTISARPDWLTIPGGSRKYIDAIRQDLGDRLHIHTSSRVTGLVRPPPESKDAVAMAWTDSTGHKHADFFSHVILACHGDQVLPLIADDAQLASLHLPVGSRLPIRSLAGNIPEAIKKDPQGSATAEELSIFRHFHTTENVCYLHSDPALLPIRANTWSSWNYLIASQTSPSKPSHPAAVSLTYNMNILQHIPRAQHGHVLVTMNPPHPPRQSLTQSRTTYRHPLYTVEAVRAQRRLDDIQGERGVSFVGAWTGYGFHEDGFTSGLRVAKEVLGAEVEIEVKDSRYSRGVRPVLGPKDYLVRIAVLLVLLAIRVGEVVARIPLIWLPLKVMLEMVERLLGFLDEIGIID